jgi:hypothetical protein
MTGDARSTVPDLAASDDIFSRLKGRAKLESRAALDLSVDIPVPCSL